jgi:hypothetical protein
LEPFYLCFDIIFLSAACRALNFACSPAQGFVPEEKPEINPAHRVWFRVPIDNHPGGTAQIRVKYFFFKICASSAFLLWLNFARP